MSDTRRDVPSGPASSFEMIIEPAQEDLLRRQTEELLQGLVLLKQAVQLGVQFDVDLAEQATADNLPNEAEDKMLPHFNNVTTANVDHGAADTLGGLDHNVVVLRHLEMVEGLGLPAGDVKDTLIDGVWYTVVDELRENQAVLALVEHLERVGREGEAAPNVGITGEDGINVAGKLGSLVFVDGMRDVCAGALDLNPATTCAANISGMAAGTVGNDAGGRGSWARRHALLCRGGLAKLCYKLCERR